MMNIENKKEQIERGFDPAGGKFPPVVRTERLALLLSGFAVSAFVRPLKAGGLLDGRSR